IGTNVTETIKTNSSGYYNQTRLIPGRYSVRVEAGGFKTAVIETVADIKTAMAVTMKLPIRPLLIGLLTPKTEFCAMLSCH
ncbi:MAG TPA: carboxypeptidase-like regulatory domain-containing protein, partial [Blastocatellia bacterium]|nr:carboxypeptidase-like regulatory domain-containing protein [Blastocatellia bacterium]